MKIVHSDGFFFGRFFFFLTTLNSPSSVGGPEDDRPRLHEAMETVEPPESLSMSESSPGGFSDRSAQSVGVVSLVVIMVFSVVGFLVVRFGFGGVVLTGVVRFSLVGTFRGRCVALPSSEESVSWGYSFSAATVGVSSTCSEAEKSDSLCWGAAGGKVIVDGGRLVEFRYDLGQSRVM